MNQNKVKAKIPAKFSRQEFRGGLTRDFFTLSAILAASGITLVLLAFLQKPFVSPGGLLMLTVGIILLTTVPVMLFTFNKKVTITSNEIIYQDRNQLVKIPWSELSDFQVPLSQKGYFKVAYLGNERVNFQIKSFHFPQFDLLLGLIVKVRQIKYQRDDIFDTNL